MSSVKSSEGPGSFIHLQQKHTEHINKEAVLALFLDIKLNLDLRQENAATASSHK